MPVLCLNRQNALNLVDNIDMLEAWTREAYVRCGPATEVGL